MPRLLSGRCDLNDRALKISSQQQAFWPLAITLVMVVWVKRLGSCCENYIAARGRITVSKPSTWRWQWHRQTVQRGLSQNKMGLGIGTEKRAYVKYSGYPLNHHVPQSSVISWKKDLERGTTRGINTADFPLSTVHHYMEEPKIASSPSFPHTTTLYFPPFLLVRVCSLNSQITLH